MLTTFTSPDEEPHLIRLTESGVKNINVSFVIYDFVRFDTRTNKFVFDGVVRFEAPKEIDEAIIEAFNFERSEIKHKELIEKTSLDDQNIYRYQVRADISFPLNYTWYPFDDHTLYMTLINRKLSVDKYVFNIEENQFTVTADAVADEWSLRGTTVSAGGKQWLTTAHHENKISPAIVFGIEYYRTGYSGLISILFPLLVLFYIALFCLAIDGMANYEAVAQSSLANVAGLIAYRFVIDTVSPVTSYLKLSDYFFIITLTACLIITFINLFSPWYKISMRARMIIIIAMTLYITGSFVALLLYVMH